MGAPVRGYGISTPFGRRGAWAAGYHTGDDYACPAGTPVYATASGRVVHVGWGGWGRAYGAHVIIDHGSNVRSMVAHLSRTHVRVGQTVRAGTRVGSCGTTGNSTGPHVHYEERRGRYTYGEHRRPVFNRRAGSSTGSSSSGAPTYLSKLRYGQRDSESVKNLQRRLNAHKMPGGRNLPITGYYGPATDAEVRLCQRLHGYGPRVGTSDPARRSNVGPSQARHLGLPDVRR